jgi:hypothetical protein
MTGVKNRAVRYPSVMLAFLIALFLASSSTSLGAGPAAADERQALIVSGTEPPARITRATVLTPAEGPPVVVYAAENLSDAELDQFTVMAFVFKADGTLSARQVAPGRRTLEPREVKYSTLVLDGAKVDPTDIIVVGINQVQRAGSEAWWRAELQRAAEAAVPLKKK